MSEVHTGDDAPTEAQPRAWWRTGLLILAGVLGALVLYTWTGPAVHTFVLTLEGRRLPAEITSVTTGEVLSEVVYLAAGLAVLGCVVLADGRRAMGLHGSVRHHARVFGHYMVAVTFARAASVLALVAAVWVLPTLGTVTGNDGLNVPALPQGYVALRSLEAGVVEETLVVALAWRLLEYLPTRPGRRPFVMTGTATALLVGLRLSYHLYYGVFILEDVAPAWLTVRLYRQTRMLLPLIIFHVAYDLTLVTIPALRPVVIIAAGASSLLFTKRPDEPKWSTYFGWPSNTTLPLRRGTDPRRLAAQPTDSGSLDKE